MLKNLFFITIFNLIFFTNVLSPAVALEEEHSYSKISGKVKNIDREEDLITLVMDTKEDGVRELNIKIAKGTNYIFVRDSKGLLALDDFDNLKSGDDVSLKCRGYKGIYEVFEIEKQY